MTTIGDVGSDRIRRRAFEGEKARAARIDVEASVRDRDHEPPQDRGRDLALPHGRRRPSVNTPFVSRVAMTRSTSWPVCQ